MRGATGVTIQHHQILRLPRKMTRLLNPGHIWKVIYIARSNKCHPPTSPNIASATQKDSHASSSSHMKRHLHCAAQQVSRSNLTKCCACHAERLACLILVTIWNVIYNARSNRCHPPTSPNTAPATQKDSHASSSSHMKRHLHCAEQQVSRSNITKYCACHAKWLACLILVTYETSFTLRGATSVTIQPRQMLRLPRRKTRMLNPRHNMKRHLQCAEQQVSPSNLTKYCARHAERLACFILVTYETSFTLRGATGITIQPPQRLRLPQKITLQHFRENFRQHFKRHLQRSDHDPSMKPSVRNPPRNRGYFSGSPRAFSSEKFSAVPATKSYTWTSQSAASAIKGATWTSPSAAPATKSDTWTSLVLHLHLPRKVTLELHQALHLPRKLTRELHQLYYTAPFKKHDSPNIVAATKNDSHDWSLSHMKPHLQCGESNRTRARTTILWFFYSVTLLFFDSSILWLYYSFTLLFCASTLLWFY